MPGKPFQSKLEPFLELIREWRRQRWSYPRIAGVLREQHGMSVAPSTIFSFVKVRSRNRRIFALPEAQPASAPALENSPLAHEFFDQSAQQPKKHERKRYNLDL
jgi:IS30 family transposase